MGNNVAWVKSNKMNWTANKIRITFTSFSLSVFPYLVACAVRYFCVARRRRRRSSRESVPEPGFTPWTIPPWPPWPPFAIPLSLSLRIAKFLFFAFVSFAQINVRCRGITNLRLGWRLRLQQAAMGSRASLSIVFESYKIFSIHTSHLPLR